MGTILPLTGPLQRCWPTLRLALACAELGARIRTIAHLTGLPNRELVRLLYLDGLDAPRGRAPDSPEWYHHASLVFRAEACLVCSAYRRLVGGGFVAEDALLAAYRHYLRLCPQARISFDRAFDLAAHLDGVWVASAPSFSIASCPHCRSELLAAFGTRRDAGDDCPFCKLARRYRMDPRVQASFPTRPLPDLRLLAGSLNPLTGWPAPRKPPP